MADSDALLIVEDWISEHYFTTDADRERSAPGCWRVPSSGSPPTA